MLRVPAVVANGIFDQRLEPDCGLFHNFRHRQPMSQKQKQQKPTSERPSAKSAGLPVAPKTRLHWYIALLVFASTFASFLPSLKNAFVGWDDSGMFLENIEYRGLSWPNIKWMFTTFHYAHYHPITWLTLGLDYKIWGMNPKGYHLTSLIIHSLNGIALFVLLRMLLQISTRTTIASTALDVSAAIGALVWAIHPLRVESVAWATERRDVLSGLFYLLTIIAYLKAQTTQLKARWTTCSIAFFILSFLSKAWGITLPVILLILDFYPLRRFGATAEPTAKETKANVSKLLLEKLPFAAIAFGLAIVAYIGQKKWGIESETLTLAKKLAVSSYALCFYVWKTIVPLNLSPLYLLPPDLNPLALKYVGCALLVGVTTIVLALFRRRSPWAVAAWFCYVVIVSPVMGLTHKGDQIAADRYTYLSLLPAAALVAAAVFRASRQPNRTPAYAVSGVLVVILIGLSLLTFKQTQIWRDDFSLWQQAIKVEPDNAIAYNGRGRISMERNELQPALDDFNAAIRLNPKIVSARNNRGMVRYQQNDLDGALADFEAALKLNPQHEIYNNCGAIYEVRGNLKEAMRNYSLALQMMPSYAIGHFNRARVLKQQGDLDGALKDFSDAVKYDPGYAEAFFRRGDVFVQKNDMASAIRDYETALKIAPPNWNERKTVEQRILQTRQAATSPRADANQ